MDWKTEVTIENKKAEDAFQSSIQQIIGILVKDRNQEEQEKEEMDRKLNEIQQIRRQSELRLQSHIQQTMKNQKKALGFQEQIMENQDGWNEMMQEVKMEYLQMQNTIEKRQLLPTNYTQNKKCHEKVRAKFIELYNVELEDNIDVRQKIQESHQKLTLLMKKSREDSLVIEKKKHLLKLQKIKDNQVNMEETKILLDKEIARYKDARNALQNMNVESMFNIDLKKVEMEFIVTKMEIEEYLSSHTQSLQRYRAAVQQYRFLLDEAINKMKFTTNKYNYSFQCSPPSVEVENEQQIIVSGVVNFIVESSCNST